MSMRQRLVGYIDPRVVPASRREQLLLDAIRSQGLNLHRIHRDGPAVRVTGPGVFMALDSLASATLHDLPART